MKEVTIKFSCGHNGLASAFLFKGGERVRAPCRVCRPSKIVPLFRLGALAAFGTMIYGIVIVDVATVLGGVAGLAAAAVFLLIFR